MHDKARKLPVLASVASAAALALFGLNLKVHAAESTPAAGAQSPTAASSTPAPAATGAQAQPTHEQIHLLHQMDPALHAGMGHPHGGPKQGPHDCPHDCAQSAENAPPPEHPEAKSATVNGTLTIKTPEGTRTITMTDVQHGGDAPCFWPVGGSIHLTGADNVAHTATFDATCGHVTLDGANLTLPTKHDHDHEHGRGSPRHKMGKEAPSAPATK